MCLTESNYCPHFTNEEKGTERLGNFARFTQLRSRLRIQTKVYPGPNPVLFCLHFSNPQQEGSRKHAIHPNKACYTFKTVKLLANASEIINYVGNICRKVSRVFS